MRPHDHADNADDGAGTTPMLIMMKEGVQRRRDRYVLYAALSLVCLVTAPVVSDVLEDRLSWNATAAGVAAVTFGTLLFTAYHSAIFDWSGAIRPLPQPVGIVYRLVVVAVLAVALAVPAPGAVDDLRPPASAEQRAVEDVVVAAATVFIVVLPMIVSFGAAWLQRQRSVRLAAGEGTTPC